MHSTVEPALRVATCGCAGEAVDFLGGDLLGVKLAVVLGFRDGRGCAATLGSSRCDYEWSEQWSDMWPYVIAIVLSPWVVVFALVAAPTFSWR